MNYQIFLDNHLQLLSKGDAGRLVVTMTITMMLS